MTDPSRRSARSEVRLAACAALALLLVGCGGDSDTAQSTSVVTASAASSKVATAALATSTSDKMVTVGGAGGDPTAIWVPELNMYIGTRTDGENPDNGISLWASDRIENLFTSNATRRSLTPLAAAGSGARFAITSAEAPSLVEWQGKLYLIFRDNIKGEGHHQVLVNDNPSTALCADCWKQMNPDDDNTPLGRDWGYLVRNDKSGTPHLWMFYHPMTATGQDDRPDDQPWGVFVAEMSDPQRKLKPAVQISWALNVHMPNTTAHYDQARDYESRHIAKPPEQGQENPANTTQDGVNEAPQPFLYVAGGKEYTFVNYSSNAYKYSDYLMGTLIFVGDQGDPLDVPGNWKKSLQPYMQATDYDDSIKSGGSGKNWVCNTGSGTIVPNKGDKSDLWIIYNGKFNCDTTSFTPKPDPNGNTSNYDHVLESNNDRVFRTQKMTFYVAPTDAGNRLQPMPTNPWIDGELHDVPAGETGTPSNFLTGPTTEDDAAGRLDGKGQPLPLDLLSGRIFYSGSFNSSTGNADADTGSKAPAGTNASLTVSRTLGSYFVVAFSGTRIELYGPTGRCAAAEPFCTNVTTYGAVNIYVDGDMAHPHYVDLSQAVAPSTAFFTTDSLGGLASGPHSLTVVVARESSETSGPVSPVALDYAIVQ